MRNGTRALALVTMCLTLGWVVPPLARAVSPAESCPAVFGNPQQRLANRAHRLQVLHRVRELTNSILLVHSDDFARPVPLVFQGLELVEVRPDGLGELHAVVRLGPGLEEFGCPEGGYLVRVDDSLGPETSVLALLDDLVLVEHAGELAYLAPQAAARPRFRLVWRADWTLPVLPGHATPASIAKPGGGVQRAARTRGKRR